MGNRSAGSDRCRLRLALPHTCVPWAVQGASDGEGLGNAFLSHISATDAIFHIVRTFEEVSRQGIVVLLCGCDGPLEVGRGTNKANRGGVNRPK